jgi:Rieske Fe-S protein
VEKTVGYPHVGEYDPNLVQMKPWLKPGHLGEDPDVDFIGFFNNNGLGSLGTLPLVNMENRRNVWETGTIELTLLGIKKDDITKLDKVCTHLGSHVHEGIRQALVRVKPNTEKKTSDHLLQRF